MPARASCACGYCADDVDFAIHNGASNGYVNLASRRVLDAYSCHSQHSSADTLTPGLLVRQAHELQRWLPGAEVIMFNGEGEERWALQREENPGNVQVLLTHHDLAAHDRALLCKVGVPSAAAIAPAPPRPSVLRSQFLSSRPSACASSQLRSCCALHHPSNILRQLMSYDPYDHTPHPHLWMGPELRARDSHLKGQG